jgi:hypothetical protein
MDREEDEVFCDGTMEIARACGDAANDEDWVPANVRKQRERRTKEKKRKDSVLLT